MMSDEKLRAARTQVLTDRYARTGSTVPPERLLATVDLPDAEFDAAWGVGLAAEARALLADMP